MYRIGIVGTGYVGLVTGLCLADTGNEVICVDVDERKIARLQQGEVPFYEPGVDHLLQRNLQKGRVRFTTDLQQAALQCQILMLCLPTPPNEDGSADVQHVFAVARQLVEIYRRQPPTQPLLVVTKSTVPPGTTKRLGEFFRQELPGAEIAVASNPEFLSEGSAVENFTKPERVIIGTHSPWAAQVLHELYEPFVRTGNPIYVMDPTSAELTKYAANAFLALRISFMNELSALCEVLGADIEQIRLGIGADSRIGRRYLFAGLGYGGSCLPKDVRALTHAAAQAGVPLQIVPAAERVNAEQLQRFVAKIRRRFQTLAGRTFALWGVAFKPNTDDIREAPALRLIDSFLQEGAHVRAYDPQALENLRQRYGERLFYARSPYECAEGADALVIATEWTEFRNPDFALLRQLLRHPIIFDGRNLFSPEDMERHGFEYHSVGRPPVTVSLSSAGNVRY
jgi:UDPglucose 6-dehydrogenase